MRCISSGSGPPSIGRSDRVARYAYDGATVTLYLTTNDIELLDSLTEQMIELVSDGMPGVADTDDPFTRWEADLADPQTDQEMFADPAMQRLFPNPYPDDPRAAHEYRRFTESDHRRDKVADARLVRQCLAGAPPVRIVGVHLGPWLKTLNALRLVLASRLHVDDEDAMAELHTLDDNDPRAMMAAIMDWLAYLQGVIIELTDPGLEGGGA